MDVATLNFRTSMYNFFIYIFGCLDVFYALVQDQTNRIEVSSHYTKR